MLLNFKNEYIKTKTKSLFEEDCKRIDSGLLPSRAWETDIYVTRRCNMSCSYCYIKSYFDRGYTFIDPKRQQLFNLIDKLVDKTYGLVILGGEPLIRKDLHEILKYARQQGIPSIRVASNGTFIKNSIEALFYIDKLNISLDSTRKKEYPDLIQKMLIDVEEFKKEMKDDFPAIGISYTLTDNENFEHDIVPIIKYALYNNFNIKFLPCKYPDKTVNWEQLKIIVNKARELIKDDRILLNIPDLVEQISHQFLFQNCLQGMQFYIDFEGYFLYPCDEYPENRVAKIYDYSIDELYKMGMEKFGHYPKDNGKTCTYCKSYCHAENSFNYCYPKRQLDFFY